LQKAFKEQGPGYLTSNPRPAEFPLTILVAAFVPFWFFIIAHFVAKFLDDHGYLRAGRDVPPMSTATLSAGLLAATQPFLCSVCFDVMAPAMTIIPCGHNICRKCSRRVAECPVCRERFYSIVPDWTLNTIVSSLMKVQSNHKDITIFDSADVQTYMEGDHPVPAELPASPVLVVPPALAEL
jgi:Zinc finger, C3HC4 type (RING finger)